jgi:hypothetical protein
MMTLAEYEVAVSAEMQRLYGPTWVDACGDQEPLAFCLGRGAEPRGIRLLVRGSI